MLVDVELVNVDDVELVDVVVWVEVVVVSVEVVDVDVELVDVVV